MKRKKSLQRVLSAFLTILLLVSVVPTAVFAAGTETYQKISDAAEFETGKYVMAVDTGYAVGPIDGTWVSAVKVTPEGNVITDPDAGMVVDLEVADSSVKIKLSDGNYIAPKGGNNNGIQAGEYDWAWSVENGKFVFSGTEDDTVVLASNKSSQNKFRGYKKATATGNPNGYPYQFTLYKLAESGSGEQSVAAPLADPAAGAVASGAEITLSTATPNAQIYYTLDGSDPADANNTARELYSSENKPVITEDGTLKAVAVLGASMSAVQQLSYTIKGEAVLEDGDQVVIYAPEYNKALSSEKTGFYNVGTDITVGSDGAVTGYTAANIWTVVANDDGTYSFQQDGKNIGLGDSYASMDLGAVHDDWEVIDLEDGTYNIKNTGRGNYMEWYAQFSNWSTYNKGSAATDGQFKLKFYKVEGSEPAPEPGAPIKDGDQVVIYAPEYNKALSSEKTGFYNVGTDITVGSDGAVTGYTAANIWTVVANDDGTYSFQQDGKNIGLGDSYASMDLGAVHDDWEVIDLEDGTYNIKNTGRGNYIEWYAQFSNWSTYNSSSAATDGQFKLKFYKVESMPVDPEEPAVEGLEVEASPKSGASVEAGQTIVLTAADGAEIYYTMSTDGTEPADPDVTSVSQKYTAPIEIEKTPETDKPVIIKAVAHIPAAGVEEAQTGEVVTFTYKAPMNLGDYTLYFGQLHAHTNLSDGTGTVEQAFDHASKVDNLDFLALTDHSNSFDNDANVHLDSENAEELSEEWEEGRSGARNITERENGTFVGLYGFEMTWSGGAPGHINTFNSDGFESRNYAPYKKGDNYDVLQAYFDTLNENPETISQFNHPGDTFGDFMDFSLYDPVVDNQITLIEVGNGEGAIGSSGYFPSYSYYTRALDKGWHVAPTNNQDNHKGNWGDSNTARSVVLATDLSEEAIYDAMKNYRVYATEDNDLSILYSLNGNAMGSILDDQESVNIEVSISDPTDTAGSTKGK